MKIKAINISSFGGLKNVNLQFDGDFSVVYGDNENGKTTVMNFIKMMFYGTERASSQISKNLRKKYTPWDNSAMAGSIDFEANNRNYRIERSFGNSNSTDKVTLIDLDLGKRETVAADIGNKLFGLSSAAFERSVFVGQFGFPENNAIAEGELNSKLSNLTLTGDQNISFDQVNKRLESAKFALMSKSGRAGEYDKNLKTAANLENRLEMAKDKQLQLTQKKDAAQKLAFEITDLQKKCDSLKTKIDSEQDVRNAEKLKELLSLKEKLDQLNLTLKLENGQLVDEMFVRKVEFCISKIETAENKAAAKQSEIELLQNNLDLALNPSPDMTPEKAQELQVKIENLEKESRDIADKITNSKNKTAKNTSYLIPLFIGIVMLIGGVFAFTFNNILGSIIGVLGIGCLISALISNKNGKAKAEKKAQNLLDLKLKENQLISVIATEKANLNAINTALNSNAAIIEKQQQMLENCKTELETLQNEKTSDSISLFELFSHYKKTSDISVVKEELEKIRQKATEQKEIKQNINYILKDVGNISYTQAQEKLEKINSSADSVTNFEEIKAQYSSLLADITERKTTAATLLAEIKSLTSSVGNTESLKQELETLKAKMANQKEYCDALDIAISVLADSFVEVRRSFGSVLEKKASDIFSGITGGKYQNMSVSKSFDITVEKADVFGSKELEYLSSGTADQAYLSLRLALCELMAEENGRLPLFLDDALAQYDDSRVKTALEFLKNYSADGQIIMFTCHNSVSEFAKTAGAKEIIL